LAGAPVKQETTAKRIIDDNRILNALLRSLTSKKTLTAEDLNTILDVTIQKVVDSIRAEAITVFLVGKDNMIHFQNVYYSKALYGDDENKHRDFDKKAQDLEKMTLQQGQGIVGKVIQTGKSVMIPNVEADPNYFAQFARNVGFPVRSMITVPLTSDKTFGAIQVLNKQRDVSNGLFGDSDLKILEEVAAYSAKVIQKVQNPETQFSDREMASYIARSTKHQFTTLEDDFVVDDKLVALVGKETIEKLRVIPIAKTASEALKVVMSDPLDIQKKDDFQLKTRLAIEEVVVAAESDIKKAIEKMFKQDTGIGDVADLVGAEMAAAGGPETVTIDDTADEYSSPIVQLATRVIEDAFSRGASDIHIEPFEKETIVRYRVDGYLKEALRLPQGAIKPLVARLKIMAPPMDISEHRMPQDGRIKFKEYNKRGIDIDLRVSIGPMAYGEKVCMRILDKTGSLLGLDKMGFTEKNLEIYRNAIKQPYGMVLHVGPTGSGKTTTLYAAVQEINTPDINIQTAEDPIEYMLKGINQMQMHKEIGLKFQTALRCFLRQDPDVILVGEIRDEETAEIAVEAALTGHLLFSTLHTNDAPGTVVRFVDMGLEPFLVSSSLLAVCAQRLMRRLCSKCKQPYEASEPEKKTLDLPLDKPFTLYRAVGCDKCRGAGYKGRMGVHELMTLNPEMKELINKRVPSEILKEAAVRFNMVTLYEDAMTKVRNGASSLEEAISTVRVD
jgi:type II secretory ATPase GspE/PulE/Tfp pilus assembly ATPase PilB-like protein/putative methionine-R-sulfoxide reductase with GAF domain